MFSDFFIRLRALLRRTTVEGELDEELRFHLENQVEKYIQSGLTREQATRRARLELGASNRLKRIAERRGCNSR